MLLKISFLIKYKNHMIALEEKMGNHTASAQLRSDFLAFSQPGGTWYQRNDEAVRNRTLVMRRAIMADPVTDYKPAPTPPLDRPDSGTFRPASAPVRR